MNDFFGNSKDQTRNESPSVSLWVEKYRPKTLDNYIGNDHIVKNVRSYFKQGEIPHLMFSGKQGTGKTALAGVITEQLSDRAESIYINASDENSVEKVRTDIKQFASSVGMKDMKIVVLDEFDYMSQNAQAALRNLMETFVDTTRFILTCNYPEKVLDPIKSRVQTFSVKPPSRKKVARHLFNILKEEGVEFDKSIRTIIDEYYPDIRKIINEAQSMTVDGVLSVEEDNLKGTDFNKRIVEILNSGKGQKKKFQSIRQHVANNEVQDFTDTYTYLYDNVDEFASGAISKTILHIADAQYKAGMVVDKEINFMSCIIQIIAEIS
jgi:replication factor C small subunit